MTLVLALALSLLVGLSLGILGGGGSILTVLILVYALGVEPKSAIATSLLVVGITSIAAVIPHARAGRVRLRTGLVFGGAGMIGAYLAGMVAHYIPGAILLLAFAAMMLVTAGAMLRGRKPQPGEPACDSVRELPVAKVTLQGFSVGCATGLVGAGGGFLVVPALVLLGGLPMSTAVGTSLVVIAMNSFAGFAGYLRHVPIDWQLTAVVSTSAVMGSLLGGRLAGRIPQARLRAAFAWFVMVVGIFMLARQLPTVLGPSFEWTMLERGLPYALALLVAPMAYGLGKARCARCAQHSPEAAPEKKRALVST